MTRLVDAGVDLLTGSRCAGCLRPGRTLCAACAAELTCLRPRATRPDPPPAALGGPLPLMAAGPYDGMLRELIVAHKEQRRLGLARPLGRLLAVVVEAGLDVLDGPESGAVLVPVPSTPAAVRTRGHDPLLRITRVAAARLRRRGVDCTVARLLAHRRLVADQAGLSATERVANLEDAFVVRKAAGAAGAASAGPRRVVVVDDVITTGASLAAALSALRAAGLSPHACATLAATVRRHRTAASESRADCRRVDGEAGGLSRGMAAAVSDR